MHNATIKIKVQRAPAHQQNNKPTVDYQIISLPARVQDCDERLYLRHHESIHLFQVIDFLALGVYNIPKISACTLLCIQLCSSLLAPDCKGL